MAANGAIGSSYVDFYEWSIKPESNEHFWDTLLNRMNVQFKQPYERIFDVSGEHGVKSVRYLPGAVFNVAGWLVMFLFLLVNSKSNFIVR